MPAENPLVHVAKGGRSYVNEAAAEGFNPQVAKSAEIMPGQLALLLIGAAAGLYALKKLGFRFVAEVNTGRSS